MSVFGERLSERMNVMRVTQKELAERSRVTESAISYYVKGQRTPSGDILVRIANSLNTTTDYLLGNADDPDNNSDSERLQYIQRNLRKLDDAKLEKAENVLKSVFDDIFDDEEGE